MKRSKQLKTPNKHATMGLFQAITKIPTQAYSTGTFSDNYKNTNTSIQHWDFFWQLLSLFLRCWLELRLPLKFEALIKGAKGPCDCVASKSPAEKSLQSRAVNSVTAVTSDAEEPGINPVKRFPVRDKLLLQHATNRCKGITMKYFIRNKFPDIKFICIIHQNTLTHHSMGFTV